MMGRVRTLLQAPDDTFFYSLLVSVACAAWCLPVWFTQYAPLVDWPNHLARLYILAHYHTVEPFRQMYVVYYDLLPNLGVDVIGMWLLRWLPYPLASKLILTFIVVVFVVGCVAAAKGLGRKIGLTTVIALYFVYNFTFLYGFVNYMLGVGVFLLTYGCWLQFSGKWTAGRVILVALLSLCCYFAHLSALACLFVSFTAHTLFEAVRHRSQVRRRVLQALAPMTAPLPLLVYYQWRYAGIGETSKLYWEGIYSKLKGITYPFASYDFGIDFLFVCLLCVALIGCMRYSAASPNLAGMIVAGALFVSSLLAPTGGYVGTWGIDRRFVLPAVLILLLSLVPTYTNGINYWLPLAVLLIIVCRVGWIWQANWNEVSNQIHQQVQLFRSTFRSGDKVFPVVMLETQDKRKWVTHMPFRHTICYSAIVCHAFTPSLFAYEGQQPLRFKEPNTGYQELYSPYPRPEAVFDTEFIRKHYDFVYAYRLNEEYERFFDEHFHLQIEQDGIRIYRTHD